MKVSFSNWAQNDLFIHFWPLQQSYTDANLVFNGKLNRGSLVKNNLSMTNRPSPRSHGLIFHKILIFHYVWLFKNQKWINKSYCAQFEKLTYFCMLVYLSHLYYLDLYTWWYLGCFPSPGSWSISVPGLEDRSWEAIVSRWRRWCRCRQKTEKIDF